MVRPQVIEGLSVLNPTPQKLPGSTLLHELIRTASNNGTPAIDFLDGTGTRHTLSYAEFQSLSDTLAARISRELAALPPRKTEDQLIIPLIIPQSPELYVAIIAILKAGGAFCPLNLDAPADRVKFILDDINANLILTSSAVANILPPTTASFKIINVDESAKAPTVRVNGDITYPPWTSDDAALAYVMYTSGSTGTPKGVGVSHLAATQSLLGHDRHIPEFSRFLQFAAPTFDVSVFEIFFPLFRGSTLVCCNRLDMLTDLPGVLRKMNVDACELTPSVVGSLLKSRHNAPNLQLLLTIGEMLTQPVISEFGGDSQIPSMLWGMYGPTEAAIHW
jgi:non-ribosomal peptide synthetase component F